MPFNEAELKDCLSRIVEECLTQIFADNRDDCSVDELVDSMMLTGQYAKRLAASGRETVKEAVEGELHALEEANKVMHRDGRVHLI